MSPSSSERAASSGLCDWSDRAFESAAEAFTASGQFSIIEAAPAISVASAAPDGAIAFLDLVGDFVPWLAQQSCECADAQASPATTTFDSVAAGA
ncbi:MAG: hypothetical protein ABJB61_00640 [bacterium]